jgi:hypothetical protein
MKFSAKFTTVSFLAAAAIGAGALAFGGCTVTSGTVNDDGGPTVTPENDGGTGTDGSTAATCEGNTQKADLVSADCQACLDTKCCTELKGCFNAPVTSDGGGTDDCNAFSTCISFCYQNAQPGACLDECAAAAGDGIPDAYQGIIDCAKANGCETVCNLQDAPVDDGGTDAADQ